MSIVIEGRLLENRFTTAQWAASTVILKDRVWGHEVDDSGNPVGSKMGNGVDLWAALPYWYTGAGTNVVQKSFTAQTGLTINWQTDLADGVHTYAALLGNYFPRPVVALLSSGSDYVYPGTLPAVNYSSGLINTVVFDWGVSSDGYIRF